MTRFPQLVTLAARTGGAPPKPSKLDHLAAVDADRRLDERLLDIWRREVRIRDKYRCQCCGIKVVVTLTVQADRCEAHHIMERGHWPTRHDKRNGCCLCLRCHLRVEANELVIVGTAFFTLPNGRTYIDADQPLTFREGR